MSSTDQPIAIGANDPMYYAELLKKIPRLADRRSSPDERVCPDIPSIQDVDDSIAQRLRTLLDVIADISLCKRGNVSATTACLKQNECTLEIQLYIVFNHQRDEAAHHCSQHLESIFMMLSQVPYKPPAVDDSPKLIFNESEDSLINISRAIHNFSFEIFAHRVNKRKHRLSEIRKYIEQDQTYFTHEDRSTLLKFLQHLDMIINGVAKAQAKKQLSVVHIRFLLTTYSYWTKHNILPKDSPADNKVTLLEKADAWLYEEHSISFELRRWALKIMSFMISATRLFLLTQSRRLRQLLDGKFSVRVLASPATTPYCCMLSRETIQAALDAALAKTRYSSEEWQGEREFFIEKHQEERIVNRREPTIHAELAMIIEIVTGEIEHVFPYIGVSKLSCIMCSHFICTYGKITKQNIATRGSHGKAYPGWFWPILPGLDKELRPAFLEAIRQQLLSDFVQHAEGRQNSGSSVRSGHGELENDPSEDDVEELYRALLAE